MKIQTAHTLALFLHAFELICNPLSFLLTADYLHPSVSKNLAVLVVLVLCMCPYIPAWVACRRADISSGESQKVHYLSDNCPHDSYLYAVSIHTGLRSAAQMSAKVTFFLLKLKRDQIRSERGLQGPESYPQSLISYPTFKSC